MSQAVAEKKDTTGFGERLRAIRKEKGLTQEQVADLVSMRPTVVARLERGERTPSWETVLKFAAALGVSTEEFRGTESQGEDEPPKRKGKK